MKTYIIYDGRASYDVDRASVLDVLGEMPECTAVGQFNDSYDGLDAVLFGFDTDGETLINGNQVHT